MDLQRVTTINRLRLFRAAGAPRVFTLAPPSPVDSFKASRPSSRNRLLGTKLSCRTKPETTSTRGDEDEMPCDHVTMVLYELLWQKNPTEYTSQQLTKGHRTPQRRKSETSAHNYARINTYFYVRRTSTTF